MTAIGLATFGVGLQMAIDPRIDATALHYTGALPYHPNALVVIGGLVIGGMIGELARIEWRLERFGQWQRFPRNPVFDTDEVQAMVGQNVKAKTAPSKNAPHTPMASTRFCSRSLRRRSDW